MQRPVIWLIGSLISVGLSSTAAYSQVVPDATLPTNSTVTPGCTVCIIEGGTASGNNLFHSFRNFSVVTGGEAFFNNALNIQNIFTRVTGGNISAIDGTIRANGATNFYLINPNGILFGPNAKLNIGGSFLATTANRLLFADGSEFSTSPTSSTALLTSSIPVGLGFLNPGPIQVQGYGHEQFVVSIGDAFSASLLLTGQGQSQTGLRVQPERTLALLGGPVEFQGGILTAPSGRIEVGSVQSGTASLFSVPGGFGVDYSGATAFDSITLIRQSALDATGDRFSNIHLQGRSVTLNDASLITISNTGIGSLGVIQVDATDQVNLFGLTPFNRQDLLPIVQKWKRSIVSDTTLGKGADIFINAPEVRLDQSAYVTSLTFGSGQGPGIFINANRLVDIRNISPSESAAVGSSVVTATYGSGQAGNTQISTTQLNVENSGIINNVSYSNGRAGDTYINAIDSTLINGGTPKLVISLSTRAAILSFVATFVGSQATNTGSSGDVFLTTKNLRVLGGAQLATLASGFGKAGSLTVNASDIVVAGTARLTQADLQSQLQTTPGFVGLLAALGLLNEPTPIDKPSRSIVGSGAGLGNAFTSTVLNTSEIIPSTEGGSVTINANHVRIDDTALVTVQNTGIGNAGTASIRANRVQLTRGGEISALTFNGDGGNIEIRSNLLALNQGSINASALGLGNGGNISIFSDLVGAVRFPNRITANSASAFGGRILIVSKGVLLSPGSILTATSARGTEFSGIVDIQAPDIDLSRSGVQAAPSPAVPEVAVTCGGGTTANANSFTISGTGGIPINPDEFLGSQGGWRDPEQTQSQSSTAPSGKGQAIVEAQGWERASANTVRFAVTPGTSSSYHSDALTGCVKR